MHPETIAKLERKSNGNKTALMEQLIMSASDIEFDEAGEYVTRRFLWPDETFDHLRNLSTELGATQGDVLAAIIFSETKKK
jgi:hypothetical protein